MNSRAVSLLVAAAGMARMSPPAKDPASPSVPPGSIVTPKSRSGAVVRYWPMAKLPRPTRPILPAAKAETKLVPPSTCADSGIRPSSHMVR